MITAVAATCSHAVHDVDLVNRPNILHTSRHRRSGSSYQKISEVLEEEELTVSTYNSVGIGSDGRQSLSSVQPRSTVSPTSANFISDVIKTPQSRKLTADSTTGNNAATLWMALLDQQSSAGVKERSHK